MPHKSCPKCRKMHGPRKKVCECGHNFGVRSSKSHPLTHPLAPEPGGWVLDDMRGMPKIGPSPPLDGEPMTNAEVIQCVAYEGLGYCIYSYIDPSKIVDSRLRTKWEKAQKAMREVQSFLLKVDHGL